MNTPLIVPDSGPFYRPGGPVGCLLLHGFTSMPEEMVYLGDFLEKQGHTVYAARLAGHATYPDDLRRVRWIDWLISVEDGLALLQSTCAKTIVIGQSMGGMIALTASALYPLEGVVAISTPFNKPRLADGFFNYWRTVFTPIIRKPSLDLKSPHGDRREPNYPAYPQFPSLVLDEVNHLRKAMLASLPNIQIPALLVQSSQDAMIPPDSIKMIYERLGTADKTQLILEGLGHSMVRDPQRQLVFDGIGNFIHRITETTKKEK
jgi:carboxylesterase